MDLSTASHGSNVSIDVNAVPLMASTFRNLSWKTINSDSMTPNESGEDTYFEDPDTSVTTIFTDSNIRYAERTTLQDSFATNSLHVPDMYVKYGCISSFSDIKTTNTKISFLQETSATKYHLEDSYVVYECMYWSDSLCLEESYVECGCIYWWSDIKTTDIPTGSSSGTSFEELLYYTSGYSSSILQESIHENNSSQNSLNGVVNLSISDISLKTVTGNWLQLPIPLRMFHKKLLKFLSRK